MSITLETSPSPGRTPARALPAPSPRTNRRISPRQQAVAQGQTFSIASGDAGVYQWSTDPTSGSPGYVANSAGTVKIDLTH